MGALLAENGQPRPWWERWPAWWRHQQRAVEARWGTGTGFHYDEAQHVVVWKGSAKVQVPGDKRRRRKRKVQAAIMWGPGTPFLPPRLYFPDCTSAVHQLNDGSLCLLPPVDPVNGWEGPVDIGFWMDRAEDWLVQYHQEGWRVAPELWPFIRMSMPGYRYRQDLPATQVVVLPGNWRDRPPGCGSMKVLLSTTERSVGALVAWEDGPGGWERWEAGRALVRGEHEEVAGTWVRLDRLPLTPLHWGFDDPALQARYTKLFGQEWHQSAISGLDRVALVSVRVDDTDGGFSPWMFHRYAPPGLVPGADPLTQMMALTGLPKQDGVGLPLHQDDLDLRRRASRSSGMHETITSTQLVIVGLGSLGSEVAHLLAQEGVRHFFLVDGDLLLPGNVARHRAGLSHAGQPKVDSVAQLIKQIQPDATVEVTTKWFDELVPTLANGEGQGPAPLFVGVSGDEATEHLLGDIARELSVPCIHAWLEIDGTVLRATRFIPDQDPTLSKAADDPEAPRLISPDNPEGPRICADAVLPGSALNIHAAANFVVRLVLDVIGGASAPENHWLFAPAGIPGDVDAPEVLRRPYGVLSARLRPA